MRRFLLISAILLVTAGSLYWLLLSPDTRAYHRQAETETRPSRPAIPVPIPERQTVIALPIASEITPLNSPETTIQEDLGTLELVIAEFARLNGGNPVGENVEIAAALLGANPKRLAYLPSKGSFLDGSGQLIDRWGTPYFFHQLSATQMEIMSAGPDRQFNTGDDLKR